MLSRPMLSDRLILGRLISLIGEHSFSFAFPTAVFIITGSAPLTALTVFFEWAPRCLLPLIGSAVVDTWPLRRQIAIVDATRIVVTALAAFHGTAPALMAAATVIGFCNLWAMVLFDRSLYAQTSGETDALARSRLARFSFSLSTERLARIAGAAVAGITLSASALYFSYLAAAVFIVGHLVARPAYPHLAQAAARGENHLREAIRSVTSSPDLMRLIAIITFLNIVHGLIFAIMPVLLVNGYGARTQDVPTFFMILNIAAMGLLAALPALNRHLSHRTILLVSLIGALGGLAISVFIDLQWPFMVVVALSVAMRGWYDVHLTLERNEVAPADYLGRILMVFLPLIYLPFALAGLATAALSTALTPQQIFLIAVAIAFLGLPFGSRFLKRSSCMRSP